MPPGMRNDAGGRGYKGDGDDKKSTKELLESDGPVFTAVSQFYSLPRLRYANIVRGVAIINGMLTVILWLTGNHLVFFFAC